MRAVEDRVWEKVDASGDCWMWTGYVSSTGYGILTAGTRIDRVRHRAHRLVWELLVGPIPDGLELDHLCRNRRCVNPDHLEPVTGSENRRRSPASITGRNWRKTHCKHGHPFDERNTYYEKHGIRAGYRQCRACLNNRKRLARPRLAA